MKMGNWNRLHVCVLACAVCAPLAALFSAPPAQGAEPQWRLVRPSNTGIPGDYCHTIFLDENNRPWIAAYIPFWEEGGVACLDGNRWRTISNVDYPAIASPRFDDIVRDQQGVMWIASDYGLLRYDPDMDSVGRYDPQNSPIPTSDVTDIDVAPDGTVWLGLEGLVRFDPHRGTWDIWTTANGLPWGNQFPTYNSIRSVAVVPRPNGRYTVWFGSNAIGVATYEDGNFFWYGNNVPPGAPITPTGFLGRDPVDNLGNIWLKTNQGLARRAQDGSYTLTGYPAGVPNVDISTVYAFRNGRAGLGTYYADVFLYDQGWSYLGNWGSVNHTYALAEDSTGAVWACGIGGAAKYEDGIWQRYRLTNTGMIGYFIEAIAFDDVGKVYINGNAAPGVGGFDILHPDGTWTNANALTYGLGLPWPFPTDDTDALCGRANGNLALAPTNSGLYEWNGADYQEHLAGWPIQHITEDASARLWAAPGNGHLFRENQATFDHYDNGNSALPLGDMRDLFEDPETPGFVWVATAFGLAHTDGQTWNVYPRELLGLNQYTIEQLIMCADRATDGTLWVGSGIGLFHFDPATSRYTRYDLNNAPLPSQFIHRVEVAPDNSVWFSSQDLEYPYAGGLTHFDGQTWTTYSAGSSRLPHNQINVIRSRPSAAGGYELWVGTASQAIAVLTLAAGRSPGDFDGDGDVDLGDFVTFQLCFGGSNNPPAPTCPAGAAADLDGDGDVDLADFLIFQKNFTGSR